MDSPAVSDNFLEPLQRVSVHGKDYTANRSRHDGQRRLFEIPHEDTPSTGFRKAYGHAVAGAATRQILTIWDLLFPLLKPPLNLDAPGVLDFPHELYRFQVVGIKRLIESKSFLLGDEMGTGKTVITSVALRLLFRAGKVRRVLVVCPKSILGVWDNHLRDWASDLSVTIVNGSRDVRTIDWRCPAHVYVVTYDTLRIDTTPEKHGTQSSFDLAQAEQFDAIVLDEAHAIKNPASGRAKAVRRLARRSAYRWALTGTPIQNSIDDIRSVFAVLRPKLFRATEQISAAQARDRIEPYFLRRRKKDVFPELPSKIRSDEWLELDANQKAEYEAMLCEGRREFQNGTKEFTRIHVFALLNRLKQVCNFASGFSESPKTAALLEHIEEVLANDKKLLVFSQYKEEGVNKLLPLLEPHGVLSITGDTSASSRRAKVNQFQHDSSKRIFLATTRAAGEGISLTAASYVVHFDHWWNPAVAWQAEDRAHRRGQIETVNVYSFWMTGTVEERIQAILRRKRLLHDEIIDSLSESDFEAALSVDDLLEVLGLDRDSVRIPPSEGFRSGGSITDILEALRQLDPFTFERAVKQVFQNALGYPNARVTSRSADGGIDIEATRVRHEGVERIVVQCKRTSEVGVSVARELLGVVSADPSLTRGFLVTSGRLTRPCRDFCNEQGRIEGIDGIGLAKLIRDSGIDLHNA